MTEGEITELVTLVCYEEAVPRPTIWYGETADAEYQGWDDEERWELHLPLPSWASEYDPECFTDGRYALTVLHELAHHIDFIRNKRVAHTPFMYGKLFQLCVRHGVDLVFAFENETEYKPRAAKRGWNLFKQWALA